MREPILVLRLSSLGDVVLTSSFLESLADRLPEAQLSFVVREDLAALASALPHVRRVVAVRRDAGGGALLRLGSELASTPWTHVFDLHASLRSRLLTWRLRQRVRPGFNKQTLARWTLVHAKRDLYPRSGGAHSLRERMLEPLRRMGWEPRLHPTRLVLPNAARDAARALDDGVLHIGVAPGARWPSKRWPATRFAALASRLAAGAGARIVLVGGGAERETCAAVAAAVGASCVDFSGRLGILETAAVLERCALVVTNDSGLLHVAEAVGRPVVAFFGPTAPQFGYAPYRAESRLLREAPACSPCSKNGSRPCFRPTHECMENIAVDAAFDAAVEILRAPTSQPV